MKEMSATIAILMNIAFAAALVGAWAWHMAAARHLRERRAEEAHVLDLTGRRSTANYEQRAAVAA